MSYTTSHSTILSISVIGSLPIMAKKYGSVRIAIFIVMSFVPLL